MVGGSLYGFKIQFKVFS